MILDEPVPQTPPPSVTTRGPRDRLDWIAQRVYGYTSGAVEALLEANPRLSHRPVWLPPGLVVVVPQLQAPSSARVRLWS